MAVDKTESGGAGANGPAVNSKNIFDEALKCAHQNTQGRAKIILGFGLALVVVTVVLTIQDRFHVVVPGIAGQDILMATLALLVILLGVALQTLTSGMIAKLLLESLNIERELAVMRM